MSLNHLGQRRHHQSALVAGDEMLHAALLEPHQLSWEMVCENVGRIRQCHPGDEARESHETGYAAGQRERPRLEDRPLHPQALAPFPYANRHGSIAHHP